MPKLLKWVTHDPNVGPRYFKGMLGKNCVAVISYSMVKRHSYDCRVIGLNNEDTQSESIDVLKAWAENQISVWPINSGLIPKPPKVTKPKAKKTYAHLRNAKVP